MLSTFSTFTYHKPRSRRLYPPSRHYYREAELSSSSARYCGRRASEMEPSAPL